MKQILADTSFAPSYYPEPSFVPSFVSGSNEYKIDTSAQFISNAAPTRENIVSAFTPTVGSIAVQSSAKTSAILPAKQSMSIDNEHSLPHISLQTRETRDVLETIMSLISALAEISRIQEQYVLLPNIIRNLQIIVSFVNIMVKRAHIREQYEIVPKRTNAYFLKDYAAKQARLKEQSQRYVDIDLWNEDDGED